MSGIKPVIREVREAVLDGFAHAKDKLHQVTDNMNDHLDDVARQVRDRDNFDDKPDGPGGPGSRTGDSNGQPYTHGVRFFGEDQLDFFMRENATLGVSGKPVFMMPAEDAVNVNSAFDAAIETGLAPSVSEAALNGRSVYGAMIPVDHLPQRLPTVEDAGGFEHFLPGGHTAVNIDGTYFPNSTREFVVDGGTPLPPGTVIFELRDGGVWDILGIYG